MASFVKFDNFSLNLAKGLINLKDDQLLVASTNSTPNKAWETFADIPTTSGLSFSLNNQKLTETNGVVKLTADDHSRVASVTYDPFRYLIMVHVPTTTLIAYCDLLDTVNVTVGKPFKFDIDQAIGLLKIS